ncbi:MAG: hypothetical protein EPO42_11715 [Gallionellaceae bacterium]|nr:MAG: hypothetical protein EPO42_11715 [Gallionellaceae bacterium]
MDNSTKYYAKGTTAENLRTLLEFWLLLMAEAEESRLGMLEDKAKLLGDDVEPFAWCYLYELPIRDHLNLALAGIAQNLDGILDLQQMVLWLKQLAVAPSQASEIPKVATQVGQHFEAMDTPSKELAEKMRPHLAEIFGNAWSMVNTLRCVLYHGCFLNELIERIRVGDDKALFDAIRIDSTVICCLSVSNRISKAALLQDNSFFAKLKAAINGKMAKREQANFQKMRLVFEVLHEAGANRLSDAQLQELFVDELKLYSGNAKGGGNAKALRKFADTYMKKNATI